MKNSTSDFNRVNLCLVLIIFYLGLPFWLDNLELSLFFTKNISNSFQPEYVKIILYFIYFLFLFVFSLFCLRQFNFFKLKISCLGIHKIKKYLNRIKRVKKNENDIWKNIVLTIESTHHSSILSKIKDLDTETTINLPKYNSKYDFNMVFIHKIREFIILFEIILEKLNHKDMLDEYTPIYQDFILKKLNQLYSLKYQFRAKLIFSKLVIYFIPFLFLLGYIYLLSIMKIEKYIFFNPYLDFFLGLGILVFSIPILLMSSNYIKKKNLWIMNTFQVSFTKNLMLQTIIQIILVSFITILMIKGFSLLEGEEQEHITAFKNLFNFFKDIVFGIEFPNKSFSNIFDNKNLKNIENYILLTKLIIGVMGTIILFDIFNNYLKKYDQFFYEQKIKRYLLPPELLKVIASFFIMTISMVYLYFMITAYPYSQNLPCDTNRTKAQITLNNKTLAIPKSKQYIIDTQGITNLTKAIKEHKSLEDLLPFGIFIALLGTLLSVAGRDIMANYFTGLSMKMDIPYEIGDRVKIGNSEILEIRNIGLRNDKFYEISSNSIISIPHSVLASSIIKNYTYPTLDYRDELSIYVKNNSNNLEKTPREAEKILLASAFINTGVKLPKISQEIVDKIKDEKIDIGKNVLKKFNTKKYSILENELFNKDNTLGNDIEKVWERLKIINRDDNTTKHKSLFFKNLFIEKLPIDLLENKIENIYIKKVIIAIVNSVIEYQDLIDKYFYSKSDKYGIRRKYDIFNNEEVEEKKVKDFAEVLVNISFYYYMLANRLWELKDKQSSFAQKRKIDNSMIQILNVPRVSSTQELNDAHQKVWKATLLITLELGEQRDETLHHINMYIDAIWDIFLKTTEAIKLDSK